MKKKLIIIILVAILLIILAIYFSFSLFTVSETSMEPTLKDGELILVSKTAYLFSEPKRGDVIIFEEDDKKFVKRVVAFSSEMVEIDSGQVKINNNVMTEKYIKGNYTFGNQRISLGNNQYYVLGDNREPNQSIDSRIFGPLNKKRIIGKVIGILSGGYHSLENGEYQFGV